MHLTRDPMDACFASYKQLFADAYLHSYDLEEMARHHVRYRRLMDAWRERFPGQFVDVDYEALVSDPEGTLRPVLHFIGLSWNPVCLDYFKGAARSSTASAARSSTSPRSRPSTARSVRPATPPRRAASSA